MSLRLRVLIGGLLLVAAVLTADVVVAVTVRSYLLGQLDSQLERRAVAIGVGPAFPVFPPGLGRFDTGSPGTGVGPPTGANSQRLLSDFYLDFRDTDGNLVRRFRPGLDDEDAAGPRLTPATVVGHASVPDGPLGPFTAASEQGGGSWRTAAVRRADGFISVTALSMDTTENTIERVVAVEVAVTVAVMAAAGAVAAWILRQGVRPLAAMTATAGTIAGGDLSRRVTDDNPRTEAGQLGGALNQMLTQIEDAFRQREASEERLRRFVADASHELRTPLTTILGYTDLWYTGALRGDEELGEAIRRMQSEALRMGVLVDDLLLLAGLDQGRPMEHYPVRLDHLAADAVADTRAIEPDRPVRLEADEVTVTGDEARLRQVVANLLTNARVHTPAGTPVTVTVTSTGDWAVLSVSDQGPGLPPEQAAHVFERFYRADPGRARARGGSGLGLSIVAAIAQAHGGCVTVDTAPGHGARFDVRLPVTGGPPAHGLSSYDAAYPDDSGGAARRFERRRSERSSGRWRRRSGFGEGSHP